MNVRIALISFALALSSPAWAAEDKEHKPQQGGQLAVVKDVDYELVATASAMRLYVRDHGKAVDVSKATAKLTLLSGAEKQEIELKPSADKLEATGAFKLGAGTKAVAVVTNGGKQTIARFVLK